MEMVFLASQEALPLCNVHPVLQKTFNPLLLCSWWQGSEKSQNLHFVLRTERTEATDNNVQLSGMDVGWSRELCSILGSFNCQHNLQSLGRRVSARNDLDKVVPADTSVWNWLTYNWYRKTYAKWRQHHFRDRLYKSVRGGREDSWDEVSKQAGPWGTLTWNSKSDTSLSSLCHLWSVYFITSTEMKVEQSLFNT